MDNDGVYCAIPEREVAAVCEMQLRLCPVLKQQGFGEVYPFHPREAQSLKRDETSAAATKKFHNSHVAWAIFKFHELETFDEFLNFFFWAFKAFVSILPC